MDQGKPAQQALHAGNGGGMGAIRRGLYDYFEETEDDLQASVSDLSVNTAS